VQNIRLAYGTCSLINIIKIKGSAETPAFLKIDNIMETTTLAILLLAVGLTVGLCNCQNSESRTEQQFFQ
jgi:hypothetical protein